METNKISVRNTPEKGRGIFAKVNLNKGELIEECPVIVLKKDSKSLLDKTELKDYYFEWGHNNDEEAIALGFGSLYNHSYSPNAIYVPNYNKSKLIFKTIVPITAGEEITVNYNANPKDKSSIWFNPKN